MKKIVFECPFCGERVAEYTHRLNRVLVGGLSALYKAGGRARSDKLNLSYSEFANFQKLKYFGLAVQSGKNREWIITEKGTSFLLGIGECEDYVVTVRNAVKSRSSNRIKITSVKEYAQFKEDWESERAVFNIKIV